MLFVSSELNLCGLKFEKRLSKSLCGFDQRDPTEANSLGKLQNRNEKGKYIEKTPY